MGKLPTLTMVRFIAAIGVVWFHYGRYVVNNSPIWLKNITASGYIGVTFFFILSGFILVYVYNGSDLKNRTDQRNFYIRRVARIYPVYVLAWCMFGIWYVLDTVQTNTNLVYSIKWAGLFGSISLVLVQCWVPSAASQWNWPGWSLSCEAFFYLCFPWLFITIAKIHIRLLFPFLCSLMIISAILTIVLSSAQNQPLLAGTPLATKWGEFIGQLPPLQIITFLMGVILGQMYVSGIRLKIPILWILAASCAIIATIIIAPKTSIFGVQRDMLFASEFCLLIYALACMRTNPQGLVATAAIMLGNASYTMYIMQTPVWKLYWITRDQSAIHNICLLDVLIFIALLIGVSIIIYLFFERPAEWWIKHHWMR